MITIQAVDCLFASKAPHHLSESWDNDGVMLCKTLDLSVKKALVMLEVSPEGARYAVENGYDLIVTHHPLIFKPLSCVTEKVYELLETLMNAGISVLSYHTRLDSAEGGVNDCAAELIGLTDIVGFGGEIGKIGRIGRLPAPLDPTAFTVLLKNRLGCESIRASLFRTPDRQIQKVAFIGGAGKSFFAEAHAAGADAFVTGEASHNTFIDCKELDMCLFDCGHYYTENMVCGRLKALLDGAFGNELHTDVFDVGSPYMNI